MENMQQKKKRKEMIDENFDSIDWLRIENSMREFFVIFIAWIQFENGKTATKILFYISLQWTHSEFGMFFFLLLCFIVFSSLSYLAICVCVRMCDND